MTAENFSDKLRMLYSNQVKDPSPVQIQKAITENGFLNELSEETGITNMYLLKTVFHPNGKPNIYKAKNFKESVKNFIETDTDAITMLEFIDEKCIREKTGKLITRRIIKRYNNSKIN